MLSWEFSHKRINTNCYDPTYCKWDFYLTELIIHRRTKHIPSSFKFLYMKHILFGIISFVFISTHAQTVDEVIQKYTTAMGGLAAFNAVKTAKMTGTVTAQGVDLALTMQLINGKAVRNDLDAMGQSVINSYKDGKGWKINPFVGITTATDMSNEELIEFKSQTKLANNLMDYKSRGHKAELLGQEDINGVKTNKIRLTQKDDNKVTTFFISAADNTVVKSVGTRNLQGQEVEVETYYSNVKEFGGLKFAMTRIQKIGGQTTQEVNLKSIEFNVPVDEKIFDKP